MLGGGGTATTRGGAEDDRERGLSTKHVVDFRHLVDNLIHGRKGEGHHARTDNGAKTTPSRTDTGPYIGFFRNWANPHPLLAKLATRRVVDPYDDTVVEPTALLLCVRGYATPADARPTRDPSFDSPKGLLAKISSPLLLARHERNRRGMPAVQ